MTSTDGVGFRACVECRQQFPATSEFFYPDKKYKCGFTSRCAPCERQFRNTKRRGWRQRNQRTYQSQKARYRYRHREKIAEYERAYGALPENRASNLKRCAAYRARNTLKIREMRALWKKANRDRERVYNAKRRDKGCLSRSTKATIIRELHEDQQGRCAWCKKMLGDAYHLDHVTPVSRGGRTERDNLVLACPPCNLAKGSKLIEEWHLEREMTR